ncbi:MAG TPA: ion channel [Actinomycetota bacterium]|nr:ion channel [Actinomycetota bacterium]
MRRAEREPRSEARERARVRDRFGLVLLLLLVTVFVSIAAPDESWVSLSATIALGVAVVIALLASGADRHAVRIGIGFTAIVVAAGGLGGSFTEGDTSSGVLAAAGLMLTTTTIGAIGRRLRLHAEVSGLTVLGALCIYVLIGLSFAYVYELVGALGSEPFFASGAAGTRSAYTYFSFITMATVGYGDLVAAGGVGRGAAVLEGILGQIYLVTAVAALIGNLGRRREDVRRELDEHPEA